MNPITIMISISALGLLYSIYQIIRVDVIFKIRRKWIYNDVEKFYRWKHKDGFMVNPNKHNWFGLRYPKEEHFK